MTGASPMSAPRVEWESEGRFTLRGVPFWLFEVPGDQPMKGDLHLHKLPSHTHRYIELASELQGSNIVELGIFRGGSAAFLTELYDPKALLAVDLRPDPPKQLVSYLATSDRSAAVHCHYGVDQADRDTLRRLVGETFDGPLDCVVDDASHQLGPTVASFEELFPRLRPGGIYIIEDWSAWLVWTSASIAKLTSKRRSTGSGGVARKSRPSGAREPYVQAALDDVGVLRALYAADPDSVREQLLARPDDRALLEAAHPEAMASILGEQISAEGARATTSARSPATSTPDPSPPAPARSPEGLSFDDLSPLVLHLQHAVTSAPHLVSSISVSRGFAVVRRGPGTLDPDGFEIGSLAPSGLL